MKKKDFSIKYRVFFLIAAIMLPVVVFLAVLSVIQIKRTNDQLISSEESNINLIVTRFQEEAEEVETHLYQDIMRNRSFRAMAANQDEAVLYSESYDVFKAEKDLFNVNKKLSFLIIYSEENEYYSSADNGLGYLNLAEKEYLRDAVRTKLNRLFQQKNTLQRNWFTVEIAEKWFLGRVVHDYGMFCVGLFDLDETARALSAEINEKSILVFRDGPEVLTDFSRDFSAADWEKQMITMSGQGRYMLLNRDVYGITLSYITPFHGSFEKIGTTIMLFILLIILILVLPFFYVRLRHDLFKPLDNLVETMKDIRDGRTEELVESERTPSEFREVDITFNQMLDQIRGLKIEQYEKELKVQRAQMSFLQAQIRPHFYLNCLKVIYSLAQQREFEKIKTCVLLVSKHLRYALSEAKSNVPIREELSYCENYVKLWGIMSENEPHFISDVDEELMNVGIPPISLLSLVENSIRVNLSPDKELEIRIRARKIVTEEGTLLYIQTRDNGVGFSPEQLEEYNGSSWLDKSSTHIGLQNVIRRFKLLYNDRFQFAFVNYEGANVEFYIPLSDA